MKPEFVLHMCVFMHTYLLWEIAHQIHVVSTCTYIKIFQYINLAKAVSVSSQQSPICNTQSPCGAVWGTKVAAPRAGDGRASMCCLCSNGSPVLGTVSSTSHLARTPPTAYCTAPITLKFNPMVLMRKITHLQKTEMVLLPSSSAIPMVWQTEHSPSTWFVKPMQRTPWDHPYNRSQA